MADRNNAHKHAWQVRIILATVDDLGTSEIVLRTGKSKPCVWRWQERFMREGVARLLRDRSLKPGIPRLPAATVEQVVELTLGKPPCEATAVPAGVYADNNSRHGRLVECHLSSVELLALLAPTPPDVVHQPDLPVAGSHVAPSPIPAPFPSSRWLVERFGGERERDQGRSRTGRRADPFAPIAGGDCVFQPNLLTEQGRVRNLLAIQSSQTKRYYEPAAWLNPQNRSSTIAPKTTKR